MTRTAPARDFAVAHDRIAADSRVVGGVVARYAVLALGAVALGAIHLRHRPATVCPFRALTGLPCPFCGGTTAAGRLGHADLRGALAASPIAVVMLASWPFAGVIHPPQWSQSKWRRVAGIVVILIGAELWQLARFAIL